MVDRLSPDARSRNMARIAGKNTSPEMAARVLLHRMGYRYRLHVRGLPGSPDIAFTRRRKAIFIHGCFWHRHDGCRYANRPKTRTEYWDRKFDRNVARDARNLAALRGEGWAALVVWECETKAPERLGSRLCDFLGPTRA